MSKVRFKQILKRITGISTPIFGVSWKPPEAERGIAQDLATFLEDRRVLYNPMELECPHHCVESVLEIRRELTSLLRRVSSESTLKESLRGMRAACRKFLDATDGQHGRHGPIHMPFGRHDWIFISALGELRGVVGVHLARIAAAYGLDLERELAAILPAPERK